MTGNTFVGGVSIGGAEDQPILTPPPVHVEYPLVMVHPNARKGSCDGVPGSEKRDAIGRPIPGQFWQYRGEADFMPPVTVSNPDDEARHYALGYRRGGVSDVSAFSNQACGASTLIKEPDQYPKYLAALDRIVATADEEEAALASWDTSEARAAPSGGAGEHTPEASPKPRHIASKKPPRKASGLGAKKRTWSPERRAAFEASRRA